MELWKPELLFTGYLNHAPILRTHRRMEVADEY